MRIVVDINHPAHVHYFKNFIRIMRERGHQVLITASKKDVTFQLLDALGLDYVNLGSYGNNTVQKAVNILGMDYKLLKAVRKFDPDVLIGFGSIRVAHVSKILDKPSIIFDDTEHASLEHFLYRPFASQILTPTCFTKNMGKKHIRFNGFMELAALHPNYFSPDPSILTEIGLTEQDPFILVRFVSWQASHDVGQQGIYDKVGLVKELERYGRVLITSEGEISPELISYQIKISPERMHELLNFASLYIGEGATMASEAALLGTPSILVSSLVGTMGNFIELEFHYNMLFSYKDSDAAIKKAISILSNPNSKYDWQEKRKKMIKEINDITFLMVQYTEKYAKICEIYE